MRSLFGECHALAIRLFLSSLSSPLVTVTVAPIHFRHQQLPGKPFALDLIILGIAISVDVDFVSILIISRFFWLYSVRDTEQKAILIHLQYCIMAQTFPFGLSIVVAIKQVIKVG